VNLYSALRLHL